MVHHNVSIVDDSDSSESTVFRIIIKKKKRKISDRRSFKRVNVEIPKTKEDQNSEKALAESTAVNQPDSDSSSNSSDPGRVTKKEPPQRSQVEKGKEDSSSTDSESSNEPVIKRTPVTSQKHKEPTEDSSSSADSSDEPDSKITPEKLETVNFQQRSDCSNAQNTRNEEIMVDERNDSPVTVVIGNLQPTVTIQEISDFFKDKGIVLRRIRLKNKYAKAEVPAGGLPTTLDQIGKPFKNRRLSIIATNEPVMPERKAGVAIFVKYLSPLTTREGLRAAFPHAVSAAIIMDRETGRSRGFGFVNFKTRKDATDALNDVSEVEGRKISSTFARTPPPRPNHGYEANNS